jgi:hypothetical protein
MTRGNRANRSIGGAGLEQGGPNLGNDYSRDISRENAADDTTRVVVPHNNQPQDKRKQGNQTWKEDEQSSTWKNDPNKQHNQQWKEDDSIND